MTDKIRWGILSTARIGRNRVIPAIQRSRSGEVVAVASRDAETARAFANDLNIPVAYGSYDDLLADPAVDAIYNPLPNHLHAEWSIRAAEAGKPVLCEKPLASNAAEAQRMVDAFRERGILLAEAFMYRFHPQTVRVKQMIDDGAIGPIQFMHASFTFRVRREDDIRLFRSMAGGAIMDVGCYTVNVMRLMTGEEPDTVHATAHFNEHGADVATVGTLSFPSGALGHFDCGFHAPVTHTYDIRGTTGRIAVDAAFVIPNNTPSRIRFWHDDIYEELEIPPADSYQLMAEDFADALLTGRPPRFPPEDAVWTMELLDRLRASADANRV